MFNLGDLKLKEQSKHTNLGCLMETHAPNLLGPSYKDPITSFHLFHKFFVQHPRASSLPSPTSNSLLSFLLCILNMHHLFVQLYWSLILKELSVSFVEPPKCILDTSDPSKHGGTWLPPLFGEMKVLMILRFNHIMLKQFRHQVMLVANAIDVTFSKGDAIAIDMQMTVNAVIIYLAIVLAGCVVCYQFVPNGTQCVCEGMLKLPNDNLFFKLSNLFDLFDQCDSQRMLLVLVKWACFQYIWERLIDCLMRIMRRFTLRECPFTKERYDFHIQLYLSCNSSSDLKVLRRHGDIIKRTAGGRFIGQGRADDTMNLGGIKTSSVEIEHVCDRANKGILETAAISVSPANGGPEQLVIFAVLKKGYNSNAETLKRKFSKAIQSNLNPLFKVSLVKIVPDFPRTASNKLLRRVLRDQMKRELSIQSRL
ncbi:hypothetical protein D0Y65_012413 [Glycine soja]|uniref:AMP-binding enzyme C-terminal domain-containing protein n=1 Tax=Glycine soja TaxID=3848 RepID=A0A445KPC0_GLYSO|nr:hypothetical protein D0Y65_012413 [Glycine soja]RZC12636.1 hypothetical protein D0Y65_012413 [Glycine soja]